MLFDVYPIGSSYFLDHVLLHAQCNIVKLFIIVLAEPAFLRPHMDTKPTLTSTI